MEIRSENSGVLLLFLSEYKNDNTNRECEAKEFSYAISENGIVHTYKGRQTNEAPCRYLIQKASDEGYPIEMVLCIASDRVRNSRFCGNGESAPKINNDDGETALRIFEKRMKDILGDEVDIVAVEYSESLQYENTFKIYKALTENIGYNTNRKIYIDYTGGLRDTSFLMTTIIQYLSHIGIQCGAVAYSDFNKKEIRDITYIYDMMRMVNAVNEFVSNGNPSALIDFKEYSGLTELDCLLNKLKKYSEAITLCNISSIGEDIAGIKTELEKIKPDILEQKHQNELYYQMFDTIVPLFEQKLYMTCITNRKDEAYENIPWIIRWCLDNDKIQQAVTLFVEKMPEYYCSKYKFMSDGQILEADAFYGYFEMFALKEQTEDEWLAEWAGSIVDPNVDQNDKIMRIIGNTNNRPPNVHSNIRYDLVISRLRGLYDSSGNRKRGVSVYGDVTTPLPKTITGMLRKVKEKYHKYIHYLVYNNPSIYTEPNKRVMTYKNKYDAIKLIENDGKSVNRNMIPTSVDSQKLVQIMRSYLIIKIIRNNFNHANGISSDEKTETVDCSENEVRMALAAEGYPVNESVDSIRENIGSAIKAEIG